MVGVMVKLNDTRVFEEDTHSLIHQILKKIRECEKYNINIDPYMNKDDLRISLEILDCCLKNKDSKYIERIK